MKGSFGRCNASVLWLFDKRAATFDCTAACRMVKPSRSQFLLTNLFLRSTLAHILKQARVGLDDFLKAL
jgi:hypothetical protein